ncbi:hypothetical protein IQ266_12580 [filamentous cyanobacterium LEGE 11480]|uniref:Mannosyltransferase n=1 Tax=Romeriopsis navalis LEGE 11480 TaxID=2777977 RepID=A0A928VPL8_9CYAN|nr:hypothetical protein [Romeriopsis navalis]MBE9030566.1 hypothetical protein [Romeriopsis navalis LEGE 11480]
MVNAQQFPSLTTLQTVLKPPMEVWQPWLFSRLLIWVAMGLIAPNLPIANSVLAERLGWGVFLLGDGQWYGQIATAGYLQDAARQFPSVAFFPLYPILSAVLMQLGQMPFVFAGLLLNNLAFLLALTILYHWVTGRWNGTVAKWMIAAIAWFPLSLFGTLADADGLFLLLNVVTLQSFSRGYYGLAAGFGALATATRSMGLSLMPTLVSAAWQQRRSPLAYWAGGLSLIGFVLYSLYCGLRFGDLFAFDRALAWLPQRPPSLLDWGAWGQTLLGGIVGPIDPVTGRLQSIWYPIQFCLIEISFFLIWRFKELIRPMVRPWLVVSLMLWFWLLWPLGLVRTLTVVGGLYLFWNHRARLGVLLTNYTFWSLLWLAFSQSPLSPERGIFAIVALPIALGFWLAKRPYWRIPVVMGFSLMLFGTAVLVAQGQWVL